MGSVSAFKYIVFFLFRTNACVIETANQSD
jgi:hypothetical protein